MFLILREKKLSQKTNSSLQLPDIKLLYRALHLWFKQNRSDHFFRRNRNPYRVWVAEVALQQTRMSAALPKLQKFLEIFPNLSTLAGSTEDEVMRAWAGLGYYARARNLRKGAKFIMERYHATMPMTMPELLGIPSIGDYTAAAIASICYGLKVPVVDGNVIRIAARLLRKELPQNDKRLFDEAEKFMQQLVAGEKPGETNEAVMELGQKVCTVRNPFCDECPFLKYCRTGQNGDHARFPLPKIKPQKVRVSWSILLLELNNQFGVHRYESFKFLKGHLGPPSLLQLANTAESKYSLLPSIFDSLLSQANRLAIKVSHTITNHAITVQVYHLTLKSLPTGLELEFFYLPELSERTPSSLLQKVYRSYENYRDGFRN